MRFPILFIRYKQIQREFLQLGYYIPLLILFFIVLVYQAAQQYQNAKQACVMTILLAVVCFSLDVNRKDKPFLKKHVAYPQWTRYLEYAILTLPFCISSLITHCWYQFLILQCLLFGISRSNFTNNNTHRSYFTQSFMPMKAFEWIGGLRKNMVPFVLFYLASYGVCFIRVLPLLLLWLVVLMVASFFIENESLNILRETNQQAASFIRTKLKLSLGMLLLLILPVLGLATFFQPDLWFIHLLFLVIQCAYLAFAICFKYSSYIPNNFPSGSQVLLSMMAMLSLIPFCFPIPLIFAIIYYKKAKRHLAYYLND